MEMYTKYLKREIKDFLDYRKSQLISPISFSISWSTWEETTTHLWLSPVSRAATNLYREVGEHQSQKITFMVHQIDLQTLCEFERRFRDGAWRLDKRFNTKDAPFEEIYYNRRIHNPKVKTQLDYYQGCANQVGIRITILSNRK